MFHTVYIFEQTLNYNQIWVKYTQENGIGTQIVCT